MFAEVVRNIFEKGVFVSDGRGASPNMQMIFIFILNRKREKQREKEQKKKYTYDKPARPESHLKQTTKQTKVE